MSDVFPTAVILLATLLLFTHYIQKGMGGMSTPLRQFGMFLLKKAAGPATDLFQDKEGSGAKTWMQTGVFWLILAGIGGFLSAWHSYDPTALDSLSNIGWGWDDGGVIRSDEFPNKGNNSAGTDLADYNLWILIKLGSPTFGHNS